MLRRFEIYTLRDGAPPEQVRALERAFRECGAFIPELRHSVVGTNVTTAPVQMVWEHAYDSPEAYQRYMVHPYHANVLDRYLLADSPERVVVDSPLGDGTLAGYACETPIYYMKDGFRKVVLLGLEGRADDQDELIEAMRRLPEHVPGAVLSVVEPNTMGVAWFDGVTAMLPPSEWTHVWELGFASEEGYRAYQESDVPLAKAERHAWEDGVTAVVRKAVEMAYRVDL